MNKTLLAVLIVTVFTYFQYYYAIPFILVQRRIIIGWTKGYWKDLRIKDGIVHAEYFYGEDDVQSIDLQYADGSSRHLLPNLDCTLAELMHTIEDDLIAS